MTRARSNAFVAVTCDSLQPGDILIKYSDGSFVSNVIAFFTGSDFSHAALVAESQHEVIEAIGEGISRKDLLTDNYHYEYEVFRCKHEALAAGAATAADLVVEINNSRNGTAAQYSFGGILKYPFRTATGVSTGARSNDGFDAALGEMLNGGGKKFYCSQFVVYCYHWVARQMNLNPLDILNTGDRVTTPETLFQKLQGNRHFTHIGRMIREIR